MEEETQTGEKQAKKAKVDDSDNDRDNVNEGWGFSCNAGDDLEQWGGLLAGKLKCAAVNVIS